MASTRQIKSRIRSVASNKQITKAMELVASSKLRKAQDQALKTRDFTKLALDILNSLAETMDVRDNVMFAKRSVKNRIVIVITSDRGLAGAFNSNALKLLAKQLQEDDKNKVNTEVISIGRKSAQFVAKLKDVEGKASYQMPEEVTVDEIRPILTSVIDMFKKGETDSVEVITTRFVNSFMQTAEMINLLPAGTEKLDAEVVSTGAVTFEPSSEEVLEYAATRLIEADLYQAVVDARASEHAMRRIAMKNASDNASEIVDALTLEMNKVRQAAITQELSEISAGVEAMK